MAIPANWPSTIEELANDTMDLLGEDQTFSDLSADTTDNGLILKRMIYRIMREVQAEFPWPELRELSVIATPDATFDNNGGEYDYSYRFSLPTDYLRPFNAELYNYDIIGPFVYTNVSEDLKFHYIKYSETISEWSPQLYQVIMYQLAITSCLQITQSKSLRDELTAHYEKKILPKAKGIKSQSQRHPNQRRRVTGWYSNARRNAGGESGFTY
jgi:hypothetical protein